MSKNVKLKIPTGLNFDYGNKINQVRVIPDLDKFRIEIVYTKETKAKKYNNSYASIDLGVTNLITMVTHNNAIIIDGKYFKSQIHYRNYKIAKLQRIKDRCKKITKYILFKKKIKKLHNKCNRKIKSNLHLVSKWVINYLKENNIDNLIIGYNKNWKQESNLSRKVNQSFVGIPFNTLIQQLSYKGELNGINVEIKEENYTSKCDFLSNEEICKHKEYSGKRKKRGLFQSGTGKLINADVNAGLNILRKYTPDFLIKNRASDRHWFMPVKLSINS